MYMYIYMYIYRYIYICIYIYTHIYIYTCIHIYIYTHNINMCIYIYTYTQAYMPNMYMVYFNMCTMFRHALLWTQHNWFLSYLGGVSLWWFNIPLFIDHISIYVGKNIRCLRWFSGSCIPTCVYLKMSWKCLF